MKVFQAGQMLTVLLGCQPTTFISKLELGDGHATVIRVIDEGLEQGFTRYAP
jgi:electron transfer flavoprotein alpha/beta subunit